MYKEGNVIAFKILTGDVYVGQIAIRWTDDEGRIHYCVDGIDDKVYDVTSDRVVLEIKNEMASREPFEKEKCIALLKGLVNLILEFRQAAREKKDWATADEIRSRLAELGIKLEDTPEGTFARR
ncbi:MAG: hypothetical protein GTO54_01155 [Nitrososphaeria archaeon]|nr:hypothetical protein [Nitrososphaeria archaeon]